MVREQGHLLCRSPQHPQKMESLCHTVGTQLLDFDKG